MAPALQIDRMEPALYEAVVEGNVEEYETLRQVEQLGGRQVTPKGNTILHLAALHGHTPFVHNILLHASSLLCARNKKNETALHVAAREGHAHIVSALIRCAKTCREIESGIQVRDVLRMVDDDKDTALHKAVRKGHLEVVKLLVKEDPNFEVPANEAGETPVYLAAELQFHECLLEILNSCKRPTYGGPYGLTALHAAIINSKQSQPSEILKHCPDGWEMVNFKSQNVLHQAIQSGRPEMVKFILSCPKRDHLIDEKDKDGNTPLHLLAAWDMYVPELIKHPRLKDTVAFNKQHLTPFDIARDTCSDGLLSDLRKACKRGIRFGDRNDCSIIKAGMKKKQEQEEREQSNINMMMKGGKAGPVVATLIATVTFAAGITLPGGYDNTEGETQGMAVLLKKATFLSFVIADAIAFLCSMVSMVGYMQFLREVLYHKSFEAAVRIWNYAATMLTLSMIAVVVAFVTGLFAVLTWPTPVAAGLCVCICLCALGLVLSPFLMGNMKYEIWQILRHKFKQLVHTKRG